MGRRLQAQFQMPAHYPFPDRVPRLRRLPREFQPSRREGPAQRNLFAPVARTLQSGSDLPKTDPRQKGLELTAFWGRSPLAPRGRKSGLRPQSDDRLDFVHQESALSAPPSHEPVPATANSKLDNRFCAIG